MEKSEIKNRKNVLRSYQYGKHQKNLGIQEEMDEYIYLPCFWVGHLALMLDGVSRSIIDLRPE